MLLTRPPTTAPPAAGRELRTDVQALRALAVLAVVAFHLWPDQVRGGFVGVDAFFVISGFLITGHLFAELRATGRVRLGAFWARRVKRLLPASSLVLMATTVGVLALAPSSRWLQFLREIVGSALQVENWVLARDAVDYLAADYAASPVQHYWSLGVEEQFYLVLPLLLLACGWWARRSGWSARAVVVAAVLLVGAASLAHSVLLTAGAPGVAYFSTLTRGWEFAVGALVALVPTGRRRLPALALVGLVAFFVTCLAYSGSIPFPGWTAALPVLATAAMVRHGRGSVLERLGRLRPVALLGRTSYSVYLVHWPLIVLLPLATGHRLSAVEKVGLAVAAVALAWACTRFVEDPVRFRPRLLGGRPSWQVAMVGLALVALVTGTAGAGLAVQTRRDARDAAVREQLLDRATPCLGAVALTDPGCDDTGLAGTLTPAPGSAATDDANRDECWGMTDGAPDLCSLGPAGGARHRLLVAGDSHSNVWVAAYEQLARRYDWQVDLTGLGGCYLTAAEQPQPSEADSAQCRSWQAQVERLAATGGYDAVVVTHSRSVRPVVAGAGQSVEQATVDGLVEAWRALAPVPVITVVDNPEMPADVVACVERHLGDDPGAVCAVPRDAALAAPDGSALAAERLPGVTLVDLTDQYCSATACSPVVGHVLAYRDSTHLTATYAATVSPELGRRIEAVLSRLATHDAPLPSAASSSVE